MQRVSLMSAVAMLAVSGMTFAQAPMSMPMGQAPGGGAPAKELEGMRAKLAKVIVSETRFGVGQEFKTPLAHDVLDEDWQVTPVTVRV